MHGGRIYHVLGATGGVGAALCRRLRAEGAGLLISARNEAQLRALAAEIGAEAMAVDPAQADQVEAAVDRTVSLYGRLDGAVSCVGSLLLKPAHLTTDGEWRQTIAQSLDSAFYLLRSAVKRMNGEGGSIVLVSSAAASVGLAHHEAISAAKAGLIGLALSAAASYAARRIRVNCVGPGLLDAALRARILGQDASRRVCDMMHLLRRPDEIARAVSWLLSAEQSWVTGQLLGLDGGLNSSRTA